MIIVVGGNARKVGKTSLVCAIIRAFPEAEWRAVKVSPHEHTGEGGDTERYRQAGACEAALRRELPAIVDGNWLVESNRAMEALSPDAYIFLEATAPENEKPRDRWHRERATLILRDWQPSDGLPAAVRALISSLLESR